MASACVAPTLNLNDFSFAYCPTYPNTQGIHLTNILNMKHILYLAAIVHLAYSKTASQLCASTAERASDGN